jgi:hypothetical protein
MGEQYPNADGYEVSFNSIELRWREKTYTGFKALKYKHGKDSGFAEGSPDEPLGHTRGTYKGVEGSIMVLRRTFDAMVADIGPGYLDAVFEIRATMAEGTDTRTDIIRSVKILEESFGGERGPDPLYVERTFKGLKLLPNGVEPLSVPLQ